MHATWRQGGVPAVQRLMAPPGPHLADGSEGADPGGAAADGVRRVLVHSTGFRLSPYADVRPAGDDAKDVARKLWHRSPGSPG